MNYLTNKGSMLSSQNLLVKQAKANEPQALKSWNQQRILPMRVWILRWIKAYN